jgi:hypothetical protein
MKAGEPAGGIAATIEEAIRLYDQKGNLPTAAAARERLEEQRLRAG